MTGLAEVLAAHREDPAYPDTCLCETEAAPENERRGHYAAHVAAAVTAWVAERLAEADVREAVADEITDAHWCESNYTSGCNCKTWRIEQADAALTAVVGALGVES